MDGGHFLLSYLNACVSGNLAFSDCGPVWQFGAIAALFVAAVVVLLALVMQPERQSVRN